MKTTESIDALVSFFEHLTPESVARFSDFYAETACFKDPFNEVHDRASIEKIFRHMYDQVDEPRFVVSERVVDAEGALLVWTLHYRFRQWRRQQPQRIDGVSHLKFDTDGKVIWHRDYWDAAEELYAKLPVIGGLLRALRKRFAA